MKLGLIALISLISLISLILLISFISIIQSKNKKLNLSREKYDNSGSIDALLLTCIDYRFVDNTVKFMNTSGYLNNYDLYVLAGASLGVNQHKYPYWSDTFWNHVDIARKLHNIKKIIVMEHEDCGMYKLIYDKEDMMDKADIHLDNLMKLKDKLSIKYPDLSLEGFFIKLDGNIDRLI